MENPFEVINRRLENIESLLLDLKHGEFPSVKGDYDMRSRLSRRAQNVVLDERNYRTGENPLCMLSDFIRHYKQYGENDFWKMGGMGKQSVKEIMEHINKALLDN